jgi:hypothetical protein
LPIAEEKFQSRQFRSCGYDCVQRPCDSFRLRTTSAAPFVAPANIPLRTDAMQRAAFAAGGYVAGRFGGGARPGS